MEKVTDDDDGEMEATEWELDVDEESPEINLVEIISQLENIGENDLSPIYQSIDSLVTQLFSDPPPPEAQAMIQFTYQDYRIDVHQSGHATVMKIPPDR